jgi:hypothetical protein
MGILDFFRKRKQPCDESWEQKVFAGNVLLILAPTVKGFGFKEIISKSDKYSTTIVFRKKKQYIKISSTSYPTDYPYYYNVILGEGDSNNFFEYDWNSIAIWRLAQIVEASKNISAYNFPVGDPLFESTIKLSLENANKHLLEYGIDFLEGDLTLFYQARKKLNQDRESYKISKIGKTGVYETTSEPKSTKQKKKYS